MKKIIQIPKYAYFKWHIIVIRSPIKTVNFVFVDNGIHKVTQLIFNGKKRDLKSTSGWISIGHKIHPNVSGMTGENDGTVGTLASLVNNTGIGTICFTYGQ